MTIESSGAGSGLRRLVADSCPMERPGSAACCCPTCGGPVAAEELLIDPDRSIVARGGREARLTAGDMRVFMALAAARPRVLAKDDLYDAVYGDLPGPGPDPKILDIRICRLRPAIAPLDLRIETYWGRGYALADGTGSGRSADTVSARELRLAGTRHDATVRALLERGFHLQTIGRHLGLHYRTAQQIIDRVRAGQNLRNGTAGTGEKAS